ncbi:fungal-specific transcription factor domain-containing protein [Ilyonectria sp. MPI-CAGE-AT-0026]|nr:fungal-specific transcription factor domain-containing protein [Ilyonectria sp. MPI-CAGE-AT-0026]
MSTKPHLRPYAARRPPLFRVKTGCFTCRGRKKKCDEVKPLCSGCKRNKLNCRWPTTAQGIRRPHIPNKGIPQQESTSRAGTPSADTVFGVDTGQESLMPLTESDEDGATDVAMTMTTIIVSYGLPPDTSSHLNTYDSPSLPLTDFQSTCLPTLPNMLPPENDNGEDASNSEAPIGLGEIQGAAALLVPTHASSIPKPVSPFPCQDSRSLELLSHYLSRTALSMGNGSTDVNPFISQLVPLSFANGVILDLLLCQSAAHRAIEDTTKLGVAHGHYNKSLRMFRKSIQDFIDGQETNSLWIVVGALIMCFTETTKGDSHGTVFDHIKGVGPLLGALLNDSNTISNELRNFIIEYYVYTASISMISTDPASSSTLLLNPELERQGEMLVEIGYVGQLCGSWLELLLLLPQIFRFGQRLRAPDKEPKIPTADDFVVFSILQRRILSFQPLSLFGNDVALCGEIFKQAIHLYLLTALTGSQEKGGPLNLTAENSIDQAFEHLRHLPSTSRINTSLCWALGVIGSCVADEDRRNELRTRLDIMFLTIGLGNIRATSTLLEHVWALPTSEQGPWAIWRVMRDNQVWISFA